MFKLLPLALAALTGVASTAKADDRASATAAPDGVSASDWAGIREAYQAQRHAVAPDARGEGCVARNPELGWTVRFDEHGFTAAPDGKDGWTWGLDLQSWDRAGKSAAQQNAAARASLESCGGRVEHAWGAGLTEWYINDARGLEHGYTIHQRLKGSTPLQLTLSVRGNLRPQVSADGLGVVFADAAGGAIVNYSGLRVFDARGAGVPAYFSAAAGGTERGELVFTVDDRNACYPLTIDPLAQQAYLKASNTGAGDLFGTSVAISGDTVVVGAPGEASNAAGVNGNQADNSLGQAGAAYVFVRSGTIWTQQAYLKASNTGATDNFGWSVAVSGDTIVVGAYLEASSATGVNGNQADNSATGAGAAYVFVRSGTTWTQQAYLKASNTGAGDNFGWSVGVSGDTIVVAAYSEASNATGVNGNQANNSATGAGAAYVFVRSGTAWTQQAYLKASNTGTGDAFGNSAAISGDTIVVGAFQESSNATGVNGNQADNSAISSGAAYVFVRSGATWSQQAYLKASNTGAGDVFGYSVAVSGDTVVVGAANEASNAPGVNGNQANNSASGAGAAYVFVRSGTAWSQQGYLKASNPETNDKFGISVAVSGDTIVVGAYLEDSNATGVNGIQADNSVPQSGAAYVFARSGTAWTQQAYLKASNGGANDFFGYSVAVSGDTVVVGAYQESSNAVGVNGNQVDNSANLSGAAYVFFDCAPVFAQQPASHTMLTGDAATFSVAVTVPGTLPLTYQWRRNGVNLANGGNVSGATGPMLTINPLTLADDGSAIDCIVTNSCTSVRSDPAGLGVTWRCPADFNHSGAANVTDIFDFLAAWFAGCP